MALLVRVSCLEVCPGLTVYCVWKEQRLVSGDWILMTIERGLAE